MAFCALKVLFLAMLVNLATTQMTRLMSLNLSKSINGESSVAAPVLHIFFSPGSDSSLCKPNLSPHSSMGILIELLRGTSKGQPICGVVMTWHPGPTRHITICCSLNFPNSDSLVHFEASTGLVDHAQNSFRLYNLQHLFKVEPHLLLNDLSTSFGPHSSV